MANELQGRKVAILIAPVGTEQVEFTEPKKAAENAGATVEVIGVKTESAQTMNHDTEKGETYEVDRTFADVSVEDYDALVVPGGTVGADKLRAEEEAVQFVKTFVESGKPVAVICHGPWLLVEADVVNGRRLTSYPSLKTDIFNAGGEWVDEEVVVDQNLITSRNPHDLPAFCAKLLESVAAGEMTQGVS